MPMLKLLSELFECQNFVWNFWTSFRLLKVESWIVLISTKPSAKGVTDFGWRRMTQDLRNNFKILWYLLYLYIF